MSGRRLQHWWNWRILRRRKIPLPVWSPVVRTTPLLRELERPELSRLRELASLFLHEKTLSGAAGMELSKPVRAGIAAQACVLILELDLSYYAGWHEVIVYPESFVVSREVTDPSGIVHADRRVLGGEAWQAGPVILSWADIRAPARGSNVVLHEFAHKLDMLNGVANGMPPLHRDMVRGDWTRALSEAFADLSRALAYGQPTALDAYGAEDPAEFFAVATECFFTDPQRLYLAYPQVYGQLRLFYRQHPLERASARIGVSHG